MMRYLDADGGRLVAISFFTDEDAAQRLAEAEKMLAESERQLLRTSALLAAQRRTVRERIRKENP